MPFIRLPKKEIDSMTYNQSKPTSVREKISEGIGATKKTYDTIKEKTAPVRQTIGNYFAGASSGIRTNIKKTSSNSSAHSRSRSSSKNNNKIIIYTGKPPHKKVKPKPKPYGFDPGMSLFG